ncbi:MAG TPA: hypothetical protein PLK25_00150 [Bacteroidales bacterium]|nr:hypothetical protein [Bacteroidales bacterium]HRC78108.1 hypothetical protein [Bacteroidales bacterium]
MKKIIIFLIILVTVLLSCNNNDIGYNADNKYSDLIIQNIFSNKKEIPIITNKEEIYKILGAPKKTKSDMHINLLENNKFVRYNSTHYIWDDFYYIEINGVLFLANIFFKNNKDIKLVAKKDIIFNKNTRMSFIKRKFPDSYNDRYALSHYCSDYYPDDLKNDLIVVPFNTQYGTMIFYFYNNRLFYLDTGISIIESYKENHGKI